MSVQSTNTFKSYKINVLHCENPHLIWVESFKGPNMESELEQIGIFGLTEVRYGEGEQNTALQSVEWDGGIAVFMKYIFNKARDLTFLPILMDPKNSAFLNKPHVFGEISYRNESDEIIMLGNKLSASHLCIRNITKFIGLFLINNLANKIDIEVSENLAKAVKLNSHFFGDLEAFVIEDGKLLLPPLIANQRIYNSNHQEIEYYKVWLNDSEEKADTEESKPKNEQQKTQENIAKEAESGA